MTGAESELLSACRDIRVLASVWWSAWIGTTIVAITFGVLYQWGIRSRLPKMRATLKRVAGERDAAVTEGKILKGKAETIGREAQKAIDIVEGRLLRRDQALAKTEKRLVEQNKELADLRDLNATLEGFLAAVKSHGDSWVDQASIDAVQSGEQATK